MARHLGWLGPAIVLVGAGAAGLGVWYMIAAKPVPGDPIDTLAIDTTRSIVVRREAGGDHAFVELRDGDELRWQAFVPHYAGRVGAPGIAWSARAVSIRVDRDGRAEVFAVAMSDAHKLGGMRLAPDHGPVPRDPSGPVTLTDHVRSYEIVAGADWHQLVAIDLDTGKALWKTELGRTPIDSGGVDHEVVWIEQAGVRRSFESDSGAEVKRAANTQLD
jgi:hypothetical protein